MGQVGTTEDNWGKIGTFRGFSPVPCLARSWCQGCPGLHTSSAVVSSVWWGQPGQDIGCLGRCQRICVCCRVGMLLLAPTYCRNCVEMKAK